MARSACLLTPDHPGAVAIIHLRGDAPTMMRELSGDDRWQPGRTALCTIDHLEHILGACLDEHAALVMPHGGPRAVQRLLNTLRTQGIEIISPATTDPRNLYPEAASAVEALALAALARAASPLAIDLLLRQVEILDRVDAISSEDRERSLRLNRLIDSPLVVLAGVPNVGKSTLSNRLLGRPLSIAADLPGTTRDYTAARIELAGLVVNWIDTPGLRTSTDDIEAQAIVIADRLFDSADLVIALADPESDWPPLPREPNLRVANKADLRRRSDADIAVSAKTGAGIDVLTAAIRESLVPVRDLHHAGPWLFDSRLESLLV